MWVFTMMFKIFQGAELTKLSDRTSPRPILADPGRPSSETIPPTYHRQQSLPQRARSGAQPDSTQWIGFICSIKPKENHLYRTIN